jgi:transposase
MTLEERIQGLRLRALYRAVELGNASQVCRELGISRSLFYRWKKRFDQYGPEGLYPRRRGCRRGRPPKLEAHEERAVLGMALSWPTWGPRRLSAQLLHSSVRVAPSTIHRLLRRAGLGSRHERLAVLEHHSARSAGLLTDRTRRRLWQARYGRTRHVEAKTPGELVCLDCFYIGKLKGVGRLWQVTACDATCSFAFAQVIPSVEAIHCARFLKRVLLPAYREAGWKLKRVLTDHGSEFKASSTPSAPSWVSTTLVPSPATAGPTASSKDSREPSFTNTGESPSAAATSLPPRPSTVPSRASSPSTTTNDLIRDTDSMAAPPQTSSSVRYSHELVSRSAKVSTPFRIRTH